MAHFKKCCLEHLKRHIKVPVTLKVVCAFNIKSDFYFTNLLAIVKPTKLFLGSKIRRKKYSLCYLVKGTYHLQSNRYFYISL